MATYKQYEDLGRQKMRELYKRWKVKHFEFTKGKYDSWDSSFTGKSGTYNVEIKNRDIPFELYEKKGFMLEKIKYDALMEAYYETGSLPIYINFYQHGKGFWYNLLDIDPNVEWETGEYTKSTANGTYGKEKKEKEAIFLFIDEKHKFQYE